MCWICVLRTNSKIVTNFEPSAPTRRLTVPGACQLAVCLDPLAVLSVDTGFSPQRHERLGSPPVTPSPSLSDWVPTPAPQRTTILAPIALTGQARWGNWQTQEVAREASCRSTLPTTTDRLARRRCYVAITANYSWLCSAWQIVFGSLGRFKRIRAFNFL